MAKTKAIKETKGSQAVIKTGGKQYRVTSGETLKIEKIIKGPGVDFNVGDAITFDMVLLKDDGSTITLGTPTIKGSTVTATITNIARHPKVVVGKFKQKSKYFVKNGHKQPYFEVKIADIK